MSTGVYGEYYYGNKVSDYGLEHGYVDYRTFAKAFANKFGDKTEEAGEFVCPDGIFTFNGSESFFTVRANDKDELAILRDWLERHRTNQWDCELPDENDIGLTMVYYWDFDGLHSRGTIEDIREEVEDFIRELEKNAEHPE